MPCAARGLRSNARTGVILLVVITLLTLFAVVGITFVVYAQAEAASMRFARETETLQRPDADPEALLSYFLGQLIYDTDNPLSALRGHSLARTMYGKPGNTVPFNGTGRIHTNPNPGVDDYYQVDYTNYAGGVPRDPDQFGSGNPPYTYPDYNNMFLAAVRARDGAVLIPSYYRTNPQDGQPAISLRPDRKYHPDFPAPEDGFADVKNLPDSPGFLSDPVNGKFAVNDSIWMDIGFPVMRMPDGRKVKPLFAPLIQDLDNRVNVNVHGHIMASSLTTQPPGHNGSWQHGRHTSTQGWGPWEVSLERVLAKDDTNSPANSEGVLEKEARRIFIGNTTGDSFGSVPGRYDPAFWDTYNPSASPTGGTPVNPQFRPTTLPKQEYAHVGYTYAQTDFDATWGHARPNEFKTNILKFDSNVNAKGKPSPSYVPYPDYAGGYGNGNLPWEGGYHAMMSNFFMPSYVSTSQTPSGRQDRIYSVSNLEALLRYGDRGSPALTSDLFRVCPLSLGDPQSGPKTRRLLTTHAFDVDRPGAMPWAWSAPGATALQMAGSPPVPTRGPVVFPPTGLPSGNSEFTRNFQTQTTALGAIDLNRPIRDYPGFDHLQAPPAKAPPAQLDPSTYQLAPGQLSSGSQLDKALKARRTLATQLYQRLQQVTGASNPPAGPDVQRWLAQLAVNMVDYTDSDNFMTPFSWNGTDYVFGTELPSLVINEVYAEMVNDSTDPLPGGKATLPYKVNLWVELYNPLQGPIGVNQESTARLQTPYGIPVYQLVVAQNADANETRLRAGENTLGAVDPANVKILINNYNYNDGNSYTDATTGIVLNPNDRCCVPNGPVFTTPYNHPYSTQCFILAPTDFPTQGVQQVPPAPTSNFQGYIPTTYPDPNGYRPPPQVFLKVADDGKQNRMYFTLPLTDPATGQPMDPGAAAQQPLTLLLQRLACPTMPPNNTPGDPFYNPYVTIDYMRLNHVNDAVGNTSQGKRPNAPPTVADITQRVSVARTQPFAAALWQPQVPQNFGQVNNAGQPQHRLFQTKLPAPTDSAPWRWLRFVDRPLVNPLDLLEVPAFPPHLLTQQFIAVDGTGKQTPFNHLVPWFDQDIPVDPTAGKRLQSHCLYRVFEYLRASTMIQGAPFGGRAVGRININTIWDRETFQALADPYLHHYYSDLDIDSTIDTSQAPYNTYPLNQMTRKLNPGIYQRLLLSRTPSGSPRPGDRPFVGQAAPFSTSDPQYPRGIGIDDTYFRTDPLDPSRRLFEISPHNPFAGNPVDDPNSELVNHPHLRYELMRKMYNHVTTRSHVFAVWLTVGFFEVLDDHNPSVPPKLGKEIGKSEGRQVRHRMFAIVDRSNLTVQPNNPTRPGSRPYYMHVMPESPFFVNAGVNPSIPVPLLDGQYEDAPFQLGRGSQLMVGSDISQQLITVGGTKTDASSGYNRYYLNASIAQDQPYSTPLTNVLNGMVDPTTGAATTDPSAIPAADPTLTWLGHPGPQRRFSTRNPLYGGIIRCFSIIE